MTVVVMNGIDGKVSSTCEQWKPLMQFPTDRSKGPAQGYRHCRSRSCHASVSQQQRAFQNAVLKRVAELGITGE